MDKATCDKFKVAAGNVPKAEVRSLTGTILLAGHDHRALTPNECTAIGTLLMMGREVAAELESREQALVELRTELGAAQDARMQAVQQLEQLQAAQGDAKTAQKPQAAKPPTPKARPKPPAAPAPKTDG